MLNEIDKKIYFIRGMKVMMDYDLADLYRVELKRLSEQVKRNKERFPEDFMFRLEAEDLANLRSNYSDFKTSTRGTHFAFTENGVAMLSSVLNSSEAIQVNIAIMRIFTALRNFQNLEEHLSTKINRLENGTKMMFKIVFERLDAAENRSVEKSRKRIGLKT
jgi:hypothetical protein